MAIAPVSINRSPEGTVGFPIPNCFVFRRVNENKEWRSGALSFASQAIPTIDAEIAENCTFLFRKLISAFYVPVDVHWIETR